MTHDPSPMALGPDERRSRWPLIAVVAAVAVLIVTSIVGVHFSSTSGRGPSETELVVLDTQDVTIEIIDYKYSPANVSVPRGAKVTWTNNDKVDHTATEKSSAWDTGVLQEGEATTIDFSRPGTYAYYCTIHPYMTATITVR